MPRHVTPLPQHPQLEIIKTALSKRTGDEVVEYRVYNYKIWRDGTVVRGDNTFGVDLVWIVGLAILYRWLEINIATVQLWADWTTEVSLHLSTLELVADRQGPMAIWLLALLYFVYTKSRTVLSRMYH